jgi:FkbM family methyltransferase
VTFPGSGRALLKAVRDCSLRRIPGLQGLIAAGARSGLLPAALWQRLHPIGTWTLHAPDGTPFSYASAPHDGLARHVAWTDMRDWEATTQPLLFRLAKRAAVFVDIGAYSGLYTILACVANPALRAVTIEPNPVKLPQLRTNVESNGLRDRVTIVGTALSARSGPGTLSIPSDDSRASLGEPGPYDRTIPVTVTTGDQLLAGLPVDLIKMDVEGAESDVLAGMPRLLTARRPTIIAECLDRGALARLARTAAEFGYRHVYHLDDDGPRPVGDGFTPPRRHFNYLVTSDPITAPIVTSAAR